MEHKKSNHSWDEEEIKKYLEYAEIYKNANDR